MATWKIEMSHLHPTNRPDKVVARSMKELRSWVQRMADEKPPRVDVPPMGEITFRYEFDDQEQVTVVHSYFRNKKDKLSRFMRLRRATSKGYSSR